MDAVFLKMRTEGHVRNVALNNIIGINLDGHKDCLGMWVCETESAKYWLSVLNELKNLSTWPWQRQRRNGQCDTATGL